MTGSDYCTVTTCVEGCCNYYGICPDPTSNSTDYNSCWRYYDGGCRVRSPGDRDGDGDGDRDRDGCQRSDHGRPTRLSKGALIGIIVGSVAGLILMIVLIVCCVKRCRRRNTQQQGVTAGQGGNGVIHDKQLAEVYQGNVQDRYDQIKSGSDGDLGRYEAQHYKYPKLDEYGK